MPLIEVIYEDPRGDEKMLKVSESSLPVEAVAKRAIDLVPAICTLVSLRVVSRDD